MKGNVEDVSIQGKDNMFDNMTNVDLDFSMYDQSEYSFD